MRRVRKFDILFIFLSGGTHHRTPRKTLTHSTHQKMATNEDIAAENILKRAELARISRQLKTRLSQTNLKARLKEKKEKEISHSMSTSSLSSFTSLPVESTNSESAQHFPQLMPAPSTVQNFQQTPKLQKKRSLESIDANRTEDESESPLKRSSLPQYPPSSPLYEEDAFPVPKTPPQQKISLNTDIYNTASTNKTQIHLSSPAQSHRSQANTTSSTLQKAVLSTPKQPRDEGADLLMFLATSPSPVQHKSHSNLNIPSTPSRSIKQVHQLPSSHAKPSTMPLQHNNSFGLTPGTPKNRFLKTPGFNMNDYVNLFTPSPAIQRTPGDLSKDVNGKLIKF